MSITATQLLKRVEKLAKKHPNEVRPCQYVRDGEPCCIVGKALAKEGADMQKIAADKELNRFTHVGELFLDHAEELGLKVDDMSAVARMRLIQRRQDRRNRWGDAVQVDERAVKDEMRRLTDNDGF